MIRRYNNRRACLFSDEDYSFFYVDRPAEPPVQLGLPDANHVHLPLTPLLEGSVGVLTKAVAQGYVQCVNQTYRRSGALWVGHFRSWVLQDGAYLRACNRHIELNPVGRGWRSTLGSTVGAVTGPTGKGRLIW